jgi:hypothetical protein
VGRDGPRFIIDGDPAYDEVARLDPDGRGDVRCELEPGDVVQLSPRLWRVAGAAGNAYLLSDSARSEAVVIDAMPGDEAQAQALDRLATMPVRHKLSTRKGNAQTMAPAARWPMRLGDDCTLQRVNLDAQNLAYVLVEDGIAVGGASAGTGWLAPPQGFVRRDRPG